MLKLKYYFFLLLSLPDSSDSDPRKSPKNKTPKIFMSFRFWYPIETERFVKSSFAITIHFSS